jgi:preprotein translocase subunit SecF
MEILRPGTYIDFMKYRRPAVLVSGGLCLLSLLSLVWPGPNYGIDFRGGTEIQLQFRGDVDSGEIRTTLEDELGHQRPQVVAVEGRDNEYIIRVREVTSLSAAQMTAIREKLAADFGSRESDVRFEPDIEDPESDRRIVFKIKVKTANETDLDRLVEAIASTGIAVRDANTYGPTGEHRYEIHLEGLGATIVEGLRSKLGERGPNAPLRVEWVGPKAGEQLRDSAIKAMLYTIAFIMVYVAFRFDLRFAPGGIFALAHDAIMTIGVYVLIQKEVNLSTIAALLTIIGFSINDTIVLFDRIRENMGRMRDKSLSELINISTSQMFSRTIITSGTALLSIAAFFIWGTTTIRDLSYALFVGFLFGAYSTVYIAAPVTEWMDRTFFSRSKKRA